jgi:hypothetical protein
MSQTATITPTVPVHELWEATAPVTGDYARDCAELAREALSQATSYLETNELPTDLLPRGSARFPMTLGESRRTPSS